MPKKKNKKELVYYYYDEINDDFAATSSIKRRIIDGSYNYLREDKNILWRIWAGFLHYIIVKPIAHLIMVFGYHYKVVNRKAFKECKKKGCFVYSNHTNYMPDAYIPNLLAMKRSYVVVNSSAVSIKGLESFVIALGAIPLADTVDAKKNLLRLRCLQELELQMSLSGSIFQGSHYAFLVDYTHTLCRDLECNPHILFGDIELLGLEVGSKRAFRMDTRMRDIIATYHFLACNFTNL